jgi:hypothetical protein
MSYYDEEIIDYAVKFYHRRFPSGDQPNRYDTRREDDQVIIASGYRELARRILCEKPGLESVRFIKVVRDGRTPRRPARPTSFDEAVRATLIRSMKREGQDVQ